MKERLKRFAETLFLRLAEEDEGELASYIPELAKKNPADFAVTMHFIDGEQFHLERGRDEFTLQSVSKPLIFAHVLEKLGSDVILSRVGVEPTGKAFNSIMELEHQLHRPYNPMVNSGAIALSSLCVESEINEVFGRFLNQQISRDESVYQSEQKTAHRNRSIAHLLTYFEHLPQASDVESILATYFHQCSITASTKNLAYFAQALAKGGGELLSPNVNAQVLSVMLTCGMYDMSGRWAFDIGLPAKSGVSGALLVVVPGLMGIGLYSPLIDAHGTSIRSYQFVKALAEHFHLSLFHAPFPSRI